MLYTMLRSLLPRPNERDKTQKFLPLKIFLLFPNQLRTPFIQLFSTQFSSYLIHIFHKNILNFMINIVKNKFGEKQTEENYTQK